LKKYLLIKRYDILSSLQNNTGMGEVAKGYKQNKTGRELMIEYCYRLNRVPLKFISQIHSIQIAQVVSEIH